MSQWGRRAGLLSLASAAALIALAGSAAALSDVPAAPAAVTDGPVYAVAHQPGGDTYIGGDFSHVGPRSGHGLALSTAAPDGTGGTQDSGWPALGSPDFPEVAGGAVRAVVDDGHGGWYIGGDFTSVARRNFPRLAHILPDGTLDTSWRPRPDDTVLALALDKTEYPTTPGAWTLYAGGKFARVGAGTSRPFLAAWKVDPTTGGPVSPGKDPSSGDPPTDLPSDEPLQGWKPGQSATTGGNAVYSLAVTHVEYGVTSGTPSTITPNVSNPVVFAGGDFTQIGSGSGVSASHLGAVWGVGAQSPTDGSSISGTGLNWNPGQSSNVTQTVDTLALDTVGVGNPTALNSDVAVYYGGMFSSHLAASGLRIPKATFNGSVTTTSFSGWVPNPDLTVRALALDQATNTLYAGGDFTKIGFVSSGSQPAKSRLAALQAIPDSAISAASGCTSNAICPASAKVAWSPEPNGTVRSLALSQDGDVLPGGDVLYAGGDFSAIGAATAQPRNGLAALVASGQAGPGGEAEGSALPWDAEPAGGPVDALAFNPADGSLYAGGSFYSVGADPRDNLAALKPDGGLDPAFDAGTFCDGAGCGAEVRSLALAPDYRRLFLGGAFTKVTGTGLNPATGPLPRSHLAALDLNPSPGQPSGQVAPGWNPDPDSAVLSLDVAGQTLYAGGAFDHIGTPAGQGDPQPTRHKLAAIDRNTGALLPWDPNTRCVAPFPKCSPYYVDAVEASCDSVYAGGQFDRIGAVTPGDSQPTRTNIAELDPITAAATSWDPESDGVVRAIDVRGGIVYVGGQFAVIGSSGVPSGRAVRHYVAALRASGGSATAWNPDPDYIVRALAVGGDGRTVYAGGSFNRIGGADRSRLAVLEADGVGSGLGDAVAWDPSASTEVQDAPYPVFALGATGAQGVPGDNVYAGGDFTDIGTSAQRGFAQFTTGAETASGAPLSCPNQAGPGGKADNTAPQISGVAVADGGGTLAFTLSRAAATHIDVTGSAPGLLPLGSRDCVPDGPKSRAALRRALRAKLRRRMGRRRGKAAKKRLARRLDRLIARRACAVALPPISLDFEGAAGENRVSLKRNGPLDPGAYRATIGARDEAGNQAQPVTIDFQVAQ